MIKHLFITALFLIITAINLKAQITSQEAVKGMTRGINIGNSLDASPTETSWGNPPIVESYFANLKKAGFNAVRIPITWNDHTMFTLPYTIDSDFIVRVDTVVHWALENHLFVIINAHHEAWLKSVLTGSSVSASASDSLARFDSIWSQIAAHFKNASDSLIFEILNEPYPMSESNVNALNVRELKIIRQTNPTRIVSYSGYMWSNSDQLVTAAIPDTSTRYLIGYYHSYDPYPFGLNGGDTTDSAIYNVIKGKLDQVSAWSKKTGIPVILGEFGFVKNCAYNPRMYAYATVMDQALQHGVPAFVWDDGGNFAIYNRATSSFNEIKDILIYTFPESPNGVKISQLSGTSILLQWQNRNTESDSIIIQRRVGNGSFIDYLKVAPNVSQFIDSSISLQTSYYYRLKIIMKDSVVLESYPVMINIAATAIIQTDNAPIKFELSNNYPNPFNPATTINYSVPKTSFVTIRVYDFLGREVATLVNEEKTAGNYKIHFNASNLASGIYFYRMQAGNFFETKKLILLK